VKTVAMLAIINATVKTVSAGSVWTFIEKSTAVAGSRSIAAP
jgi:hypothetical protein